MRLAHFMRSVSPVIAASQSAELGTGKRNDPENRARGQGLDNATFLSFGPRYAMSTLAYEASCHMEGEI